MVATMAPASAPTIPLSKDRTRGRSGVLTSAGRRRSSAWAYPQESRGSRPGTVRALAPEQVEPGGEVVQRQRARRLVAPRPDPEAGAVTPGKRAQRQHGDPPAPAVQRGRAVQRVAAGYRGIDDDRVVSVERGPREPRRGGRGQIDRVSPTFEAAADGFGRGLVGGDEKDTHSARASRGRISGAAALPVDTCPPPPP